MDGHQALFVISNDDLLRLHATKVECLQMQRVQALLCWAWFTRPVPAQALNCLKQARTWLARFEGEEVLSTAPNAILYEDLGELR